MPGLRLTNSQSRRPPPLVLWFRLLLLQTHRAHSALSAAKLRGPAPVPTAAFRRDAPPQFHKISTPGQVPDDAKTQLHLHVPSLLFDSSARPVSAQPIPSAH